MPIKSIAVNGAAGSGKDTFLDYVLNKLWAKGFTASKHSSVDNVKEAALRLGWDGVKNDKGRRFLSDLKALSTREYDGPAKYMVDLIKGRNNDYMFFHIREPVEIVRFVYGVENPMAIFVKREGIETFSNASDMNLSNYNYDFVIDNNGTLEELEFQAELFVKCLTEEGGCK